MSQIHVYFLQIGFVTPAKKRSPWSEKIIYCISTSTIAVSYFFSDTMGTIIGFTTLRQIMMDPSYAIESQSPRPKYLRRL